MDHEGEYFVRLRGLPWTATAEEVASFLDGCSITNGTEGVMFTRNADGRASGEAFVQLDSEEDVKLAVAKNKEHMGKRYIDVYKVKRSEMDWVFKHSGPQDSMVQSDAVVRLRGLPFGCSKEEIGNFFTGLEIVPNGITILTDQLGRTTGDAYVQFTRAEHVERALLKHKETIGHRYVEIFPSNSNELMESLTRMCRQRGGGGMMRPRPYSFVDRMGMPPMGGPMGGGGGGVPFGRGGGGGERFGNRGFHDEDFDKRFGCVGFGGGFSGDCGGMGMDMYGGGMRGGMGYGGGMHMRGGGFNPGMGRGMRGGMAGGKRLFGGGGGGNFFKGGSPIGGIAKFESQTGHSIHMRGLPYSATQEDIAQFFSPLNLVAIAIQFNNDGRPSGDADVDFATHEEAQEAMKRHKALMKKRYIELFLTSVPCGPGGSLGGGGSRYGGLRNAFGNGSLYGGVMGSGIGNNNYTAF